MIAVTFLAHNVSSVIFRYYTVSESSDFQTRFCAYLITNYASSVNFWNALCKFYYLLSFCD